ncbi:MAG: PIN domain-containing protein [Chloroflexi bacterium]|nr:PIN domain-containing protein [Chloroflexota bacterium]
MSDLLSVFPDTGVLLAMTVFPRNREGGVTLTGEVLELYGARAFMLVVGQAVVDELDEVLDERFPAHRASAALLLKPFAGKFVRRPTPTEIASALPACCDPGDAPIFASAAIARPNIVLANDFEAFHTPAAKAFWRQHNIAVESLYGLLCIFGRRKRKQNA